MWPGVLVARCTCDQVYMWPGVNERGLCSESVCAYLHRYALSKTSWHQTKNIQISTNNIVLLISCIFLSDAFKRGHFNNILEHLAHLIFEMYRASVSLNRGLIRIILRYVSRHYYAPVINLAINIDTLSTMDCDIKYLWFVHLTVRCRLAHHNYNNYIYNSVTDLSIVTYDWRLVHRDIPNLKIFVFKSFC